MKCIRTNKTLDSHLLGKKSWNVYKPENVARVRRDEAQAKAREEEEERYMQEVDAERRIQILRGERPSTPPPPPQSSITEQDKPSRREGEDARISNRKRRRLAGEDDTDRDIRLAREEAQLVDGKTSARPRTSDAPLEDKAGHINLFPTETARSKPAEKNAEAEAESAAMKRKYEDQYTMRFSNAAGFSQAIGQKPWYSSLGQEVAGHEALPGKDVWGNEDPLRRQREMARMNANDPLAAMKKGVRQLRSVEHERQKWNDERARELEALKAEDSVRERSHRHRRRRSRSPSRASVSEDSLEGFSLDAPPDRHRGEKDRERISHRHHRHRRHRDWSRDHSRMKHHSHSHYRSHHHRRDRRDNGYDSSRSSRRRRDEMA